MPDGYPSAELEGIGYKYECAAPKSLQAYCEGYENGVHHVKQYIPGFAGVVPEMRNFVGSTYTDLSRKAIGAFTEKYKRTRAYTCGHELPPLSKSNPPVDPMIAYREQCMNLTGLKNTYDAPEKCVMGQYHLTSTHYPLREREKCERKRFRGPILSGVETSDAYCQQIEKCHQCYSNDTKQNY